jgi:hypothetical protein
MSTPAPPLLRTPHTPPAEASQPTTLGSIIYYIFAYVVIISIAAFFLIITVDMIAFLTSSQGNILTKLFWLIFFSTSAIGGTACLVDVELGLDLLFVPITWVCVTVFDALV